MARASDLRIVVSDLPVGVHSKIVVSGARGVRRALTTSGSLSIPAGTYTIAAGPVTGPSGTYYATSPRVRQRISTRHVATVRISYATLVPPTTKVVAPSATVSIAGEPTGARTLTISGAAAASIAVGQVLASGPTDAAPDGYLVKVSSVERQGEVAVLHVENATLPEAVSSGEINEEQTLVPTATGSSRSLEQVLRSGRFRPGGPNAHSAGVSLRIPNLECSAGVERPSITPAFSFHGPTIRFATHWSFPFRLDSVTLTASVGDDMSLSLTDGAKGQCKLKKPIALLASPVRLGAITFSVGPVPIVILPTIQIYLDGSASVTAKLAASVGQEASATVGAKYEHGSFSPVESFSNRFTKSLSVEGEASAELSMSPTLETLVYGVAGPAFDIGAVAKVSAHGSLQSTPSAKLEGCIQGGISLKFDPLNLEWSRPDLLKRCETLLHTQGTPSTSTGVGAPSGKQPTPVTTPGGGGGLCKRYETVGVQVKCVETSERGGSAEKAARG